MTIHDAYTRVSNNQALTGAGLAGNFFSNALDLTSSGHIARFRDVGRGSELTLHLQVTEGFVPNGGTPATGLDVQVVASDVDDAGFFLTNLVNLQKWTNITALLTLNAQFALPLASIPQHMIDLVAGQPGRRFLGVLYTALGGTFDAGRVTAYFGDWHDSPRPPKYVAGYAGP